MREIFTYGSVGGASGNRCSYLEVDSQGYRGRGYRTYSTIKLISCLGICYLNYMPRKSRIDAPGALQNIIVRRIGTTYRQIGNSWREAGKS